MGCSYNVETAARLACKIETNSTLSASYTPSKLLRRDRYLFVRSAIPLNSAERCSPVFRSIPVAGGLTGPILHQEPRSAGPADRSTARRMPAHRYGCGETSGPGVTLTRAPGLSNRECSTSFSTVVICRGDNGRWQPNYSNVLDSLASAGISNLYYPSANRNGAQVTIDNALLGTARRRSQRLDPGVCASKNLARKSALAFGPCLPREQRIGHSG